MNNVQNTRSPFFPMGKKQYDIPKPTQAPHLERNSAERTKQLLNRTQGDAKVKIPSAVRDFAQIKRAVDTSGPMDNSDKIARLKEQINNGTYKMDYDAIADRMLSTEF